MGHIPGHKGPRGARGPAPTFGTLPPSQQKGLDRRTEVPTFTFTPPEPSPPRVPGTGGKGPAAARTQQPATTGFGFSSPTDVIRSGIATGRLNLGSGTDPQRGIDAALAAARAGTLGGGGTSGVPVAEPAVKEIHEFEWKNVEFNVESGQAPSWWVGGRVPKSEDDAADPRVNFMMTMNAMIPYMSPEDQRNAAAQLYSMDANNWSEYKPENLATAVPAVGAGGTLATPTRRFFSGRARSTGAINMLNQLREATVGGNRFKLSPGYTWLQQVLGVGEQFGSGVSRKTGGEAGAGQTRSQFLAQLGALDPLLAQAQSPEIGGFGAIAQMLAKPFFSQGALRPTTQGPGGRTFFGRANQLLFG